MICDTLAESEVTQILLNDLSDHNSTLSSHASTTKESQNTRKTQTDLDAYTYQSDTEAPQDAFEVTKPGLPLEVFLEIFEYMGPRELLQLARTNKTFRAILMSRKSVRMWDAALSRIDPPVKCPEYMSAPMFCSVAFETSCSVCSKHTTKAPFWAFRLRLCQECRSLKTTPVTESIKPPRPYKTRFASAKLTVPARYVYLTADVDRYWNEFRKLKTDKERLAMDEREAKLMSDIHKRSSSLKYWHETYQTKEAERLQAQKRAKIQRRVDQITLKLKAMVDWDDEYDAVLGACLRAHRNVMTPTELELDEWEIIGPHLLAMLKKRKSELAVKTQMEEHDRRFDGLENIVEDFLRGHPGGFKPDVLEFYQFPEIRSHLEEDLTTKMSHATITSHVLPLLPRLLDEIRAEADTKFRALCREELQVPPDVDPLDLAVLSGRCFNCGQCYQVRLAYPEILSVHSFCKATALNDDGDDDYDYHWRKTRTITTWMKLWDDETTRGSAACGRRPSTYDFYDIQSGLERTTQVLQACKMDPATTTVQDMNDLGLQFACKFIGANGQDKYCKENMTWDAAMDHRLGCHSSMSNRRGQYLIVKAKGTTNS
ncbi:hypothetical protein HGRIS_008177 [Hohenbuehelia grisea]|uniref:F-box domain-containing protein n=1 Tax=Hohenbuehelia grisea TaxID=104357 RepID=A0ABR3J7G7_9AGAR